MRRAQSAAALGIALFLVLSLAAFIPAGIDPPPTWTVQPATSSTPTLAAGPPPLLGRDRPVRPDPHVLSWTLLDVADGATLAQSDCLGCTNSAASTVKVWLAGDALRRAGPTPPRSVLRDVDAVLLDSDNDAATRLFRAGGGRDGLWRMAHTCHLTRTLPHHAWGETEMTSSDLAMLGVCTAHGDVAGPYTPYLLDRMRAVRGTGRFGPVDALPGADVALKNGWLIIDGQWHVNCLAIVDGAWSIGIITRYPAALGLAHGAQLCADVTRQLATPRRLQPLPRFALPKG